MNAPFLPLFVFDGPKRPKVKRGKRISGGKHWLVDSVKAVIEAFGFEWRMVRSRLLFLHPARFTDSLQAPGEAEAELAHLNNIGVIDAVLSDDVDAFLFVSKVVIRRCALADTPVHIASLISLNPAQAPPSQAIASTPRRTQTAAWMATTPRSTP